MSDVFTLLVLDMGRVSLISLRGFLKLCSILPQQSLHFGKSQGIYHRIWMVQSGGTKIHLITVSGICQEKILTLEARINLGRGARLD